MPRPIVAMSVPHKRLVQTYLPGGWRFQLSKPSESPVWALTNFNTKIITVQSDLKLYFPPVFLHEVAHIVLKHHGPHHWREEYEADRWSINEARVAGFNIPHAYLRLCKHTLREMVEHFDENDRPHEEEVLRWIYGEAWRKNR